MNITTTTEEPMQRFEAAINALQAEHGKGGLDSARRREAALIDGLKAYAALYGKTLFGIYAIDSNGELAFNVRSLTLREPNCGAYGLAIATDLGRIETRCGSSPMQYPFPAESGWTRLNHFAAERLLMLVADDFATGRRHAMDTLAHAIEDLGGNLRPGWEVEVATGAVMSNLRMRHSTLDEEGKIRDAVIPVRVTASTIEIAGQAHRIADLHDDDLQAALLHALAHEGWEPPAPQVATNAVKGPSA